MFTQFEKNQRESFAFQEAIAKHTVGILTDGSRGVGTGTLIRYVDKHLILTAHHVVEGSSPSSLRIAFRPQGSLQEAPLRRFGPKPVPLLSGEPFNVRAVVEDRQNDVAALLLDRPDQAGESAEFYDASALKEVRPTDGASIIFQGFPVDNAVDVGPKTKAVGVTAEYSQNDSSLSNSPVLLSPFDPNHQFLFRYGWEDELRPHGFSGAAVWCAQTPPSAVWTARPLLAKAC